MHFRHDRGIESHSVLRGRGVVLGGREYAMSAQVPLSVRTDGEAFGAARNRALVRWKEL